MGTYLYEDCSEQNPFSDNVREELLNRVKEVLLDFGECSLEEVALFGKKAYVYDHKNLAKSKGRYVLNYNRFEKIIWEPAYMEASVENFTGIHSRTDIGTKVGYRQHYYAMAVSRILCECYSYGQYCAYGDIGFDTILSCLAYIGKRYGFELVENFIKYRTDFAVMKEKKDYDSLFLGVREHEYYIKRFLDMSSAGWDWYIGHDCEFHDDIVKAEKEGGFLYCGTGVYLASLLLKAVFGKGLSDKSTLDKDELLAILRNLVQEYYIDAVEKSWVDTSVFNMDFSQYDELKKFQSCLKNLSAIVYMETACSKDMFFASLRNTIEGWDREDSKDILTAFQALLDEMIPDKDTVMSMSGNMEAWRLYYGLKGMANQEERRKELMRMVRAAAEEPEDIRSELFSDCYLEELLLSDVSAASMSDALNDFLMNIFSEERHARYCEVAKNDNKVEGARRLFDVAERLLDESNLSFSADLFFPLLKNEASEEVREFIRKIDFYLSDLPNRNQREAFLWVIRVDELRTKYVF